MTLHAIGRGQCIGQLVAGDPIGFYRHDDLHEGGTFFNSIREKHSGARPQILKNLEKYPGFTTWNPVFPAGL